MANIAQDIKLGLRMLRKSPGFTVVAVLSLALGIGANTAIFSLVDAVLLRPLNFRDPGRLSIIWEDASFAGFPRNTPAPGNYVDWKSQNQTFEDVAAMDWATLNLTGDGEPEKLEGNALTANFLPLLGVKPLLGRYFLPDEDKPDAARVAIISYGLWQRRFGGEESIVGKEILLNDHKTTVIGVMPAGFQILDKNMDVWVPAAFTPAQLADRGSHYLTVVGRLKPGVKQSEANADIVTITKRIAHDHPDEAKQLAAYVVSMRDQITGEIRPELIVLLAAVGFVLLIACANLANLQLSRAAQRTREIAVRSALGAGRWRLARQLLIESLMLAIAGGVGGLLLAYWSFSFLKQLVPDGMVLSANLSINSGVFLFTLLVTVIAGILFGLAPARNAGKIDLNEALKQTSGRGQTSTNRGLRRILVVSEVALSLILLVGAGLLIKTFVHLRQVGLGMRPDHLLAVRTQLSDTKYKGLDQRIPFYDGVLERVKALPGVQSAAYTMAIPLTWKGGTTGFVVEGHPNPQLDHDAVTRQVSPDYFKTLGTPLLEGREFTRQDGRSSQPVAVINQTMARQYWDGEDPIGRRFSRFEDEKGQPRWITVVGIIQDIREMGLVAPLKAAMYFPYSQTEVQWTAPRELVVKTAEDPLTLASAVRSAVWEVDPSQPVSDIRPVEKILWDEVVQQRLGMTLLAVFAGLALLLAAIGIYGVFAYSVAQRTQEIGVRMALGATPGRVLRLVMSDAMLLAAFGIVLGLAGSFALTRLMSTLLYGVSTTDPLTFALVPVILAAVSVIASYLPAYRATRVDPISAVRYE